jgi:cation transport regulator ChaB
MPYKSNADLPAPVKSSLPTRAQSTWRKIFNNAFAEYNDDVRAIRTAWSGLENAGWGKNEEGEWVEVKKSSEQLVTIEKVDTDKRQVFGWANVSHDWDYDTVAKSLQLVQVCDHQGDMLEENTLEDAAYMFAKLYREGGEMHMKGGSATMIESMVFTIEKQKALGIPEGVVPVGWWIGFEVTDDKAWEAIKSGVYKAFSIEGRGRRERIEE